MKSGMRWSVIGILVLAIVGIALFKSGRNKSVNSVIEPTQEVKSGAVCDTTLPCTSPEELAAAMGETKVEPAALPRFLELGSIGCRPCEMMAPIIEELRREYAGKLSIEFFDVRKDPAPGRQFGIRVIPTQIFLDAQGQEVFRHEGFFPKDEILTVLQRMGVAR